MTELMRRLQEAAMDHGGTALGDVLTAALSALAAQPVEPVAWYDSESGVTDFHPWMPTRLPNSPSARWIPLYAAPPAPAAVPLTDEQITDIAINNSWAVHTFARAIERAHGIAAAGDKP